jgi:hypothetical protein
MYERLTQYTVRTVLSADVQRIVKDMLCDFEAKLMVSDIELVFILVPSAIHS